MFQQNGEIYQACSIYSYTDIDLNNKNTPNQSKAIVSAISNDITYIWGPPGTGKTTVAEICRLNGISSKATLRIGQKLRVR